MKKFTLNISSILQSNKLILILLGFSYFGLHAQNSTTDIIPAGSTVKKLSSDQFYWSKGLVWFNDSVMLFCEDFLPESGPDINQYNPISKKFSK